VSLWLDFSLNDTNGAGAKKRPPTEIPPEGKLIEQSNGNILGASLYIWAVFVKPLGVIQFLLAYFAGLIIPVTVEKYAFCQVEKRNIVPNWVFSTVGIL
jgi:hypothetical protein